MVEKEQCMALLCIWGSFGCLHSTQTCLDYYRLLYMSNSNAIIVIREQGSLFTYVFLFDNVA